MTSRDDFRYHYRLAFEALVKAGQYAQLDTIEKLARESAERATRNEDRLFRSEELTSEQLRRDLYMVRSSHDDGLDRIECILWPVLAPGECGRPDSSASAETRWDAVVAETEQLIREQDDSIEELGAISLALGRTLEDPSPKRGELGELVAKLVREHGEKDAELAAAVDRVRTLADEACGLAVDETADESCSRIERMLFEQRQTISRLERERDEAREEAAALRAEVHEHEDAAHTTAAFLRDPNTLSEVP